MSSTDSLFVTYLFIGLAVGFGHCIGMCGPLVVSFSISRSTAGFRPHLLYHGGRIVTYALLGGGMAAAGSFTFVASHVAVFQIGAMYGTGGLIVVMGLAMGGWVPGISWFGTLCRPVGGIGRLFKRLSGASSPLVCFPIGLVLGLLPCGPVYTALLGVARGGMETPGMLRAAGTGMIQMFFFGIGTVPALWAVAGLSHMGWLRYRDKIFQVGALSMIGLGVYYIISAARY